MPRFLLSLVLFVAGAVPAAQSPDGVLAIDAGGQPRVIARWIGGQWTAVAPDRACDMPSDLPLRRSGDLLVASAEVGVDMPRRDPPLPAAVTDVVRRVFRERESEQRLSSANLSDVPMTIDAIHAAPGADGSMLYYVEASKRVDDETPPPAADAGDVDLRGMLRVTVSGWLRATGERVAMVASKGELHWERFEEDDTVPRRPTLVPLGVVRAGPLPVWVMRAAAGVITLYEIGPAHARAIVTVPVRAC